ncbi:MAG TPA: hypothetical protein VFZ20_31010 [Longimicrobium sp.]|nr:hypothetical protein [Longimicrobium sp.]HEX6042509.1 hypothetical protein [Longimicrobium sp.]
MIGYHGTSDAAARRILSSGFEISRNDYDWLGDGAYFFQDAPMRALEWARQRYGDHAAVIGAEIDLRNCVDLIDAKWHEVVRESYTDLVSRLQASAQPLPRQTHGAHRLDREVINRMTAVLESRGVLVRVVRAAFAEGDPLFPGSALWSQSHIQVAVRDPAAIVRIWRVE